MSPRGTRLLSTMSDTLWILILSVIVLFAFFVALGAFKPSEVVGLTLVVAGLTVIWIAQAMWESRHRDPHDRAIVRARERRGF